MQSAKWTVVKELTLAAERKEKLLYSFSCELHATRSVAAGRSHAEHGNESNELRIRHLTLDPQHLTSLPGASHVR